MNSNFELHKIITKLIDEINEKVIQELNSLLKNPNIKLVFKEQIEKQLKNHPFKGL